MSKSYFMGQQVEGMAYMGMSVEALYQLGVKLWEKPSVVDVDAWILDYISSSGTQYIDTGVQIIAGTSIESSFAYDTLDTQVIYGADTSATNNNMTCHYEGGSTNAVRFTNRQNSTTNILAIPITYVAGTFVEAIQSHEGVTFDGVDYEYPVSGQVAAPPWNTYLFGNNRSEVLTTPAIGSIAYWIQKNSDVLVARILPCEQLDGTICMWDEVTNTYKLNQGTGNFTGGERIGYVKNGIAYNMDGTEMFPEEVDGYQLQSLSLSNGAYFDTGYYPVPNATDTHCWMAMSNNTEATRGVFGARGHQSANNQSAGVFWNVASFAGNNKFRLDLLGSASNISEVIELNTMVEFHNYSQAKKVIVDGVERTSATTMSSARLSFPYLIGTFSNASNAAFATTEMDIGQQWNITEWVDGVEVPQRSYVPWLRTSDGVVCLKNTLDGSYCEIVTGTVTAGDPVS